MIDTHTHIYLEEFNDDRTETMQRAIDAGVSHLIFPNVDFDTFDDMQRLHQQFPAYTSMAMGLHPTSITPTYKDDLARTLTEIRRGGYVAVGEVGMDLYWDKTYEAQQREILKAQLDVAYELGLPVIIHCREAIAQTLQVIDTCGDKLPRIVFHSFTGSANDIAEIRKRGDIYFGVTGIITFKNAHLDDMVSAIGIDRLLLETDSPYLAPVPKRGRRNESSFLPHIAQKVADIYSLSIEEVSLRTDKNASTFFNLHL